MYFKYVYLENKYKKKIKEKELHEFEMV